MNIQYSGPVDNDHPFCKMKIVLQVRFITMENGDLGYFQVVYKPGGLSWGWCYKAGNTVSRNYSVPGYFSKWSDILNDPLFCLWMGHMTFTLR